MLILLGGQVYAGGVDGNVHVMLVWSLTVKIPPGILSHSRTKIVTSPLPALRGIDAVQVSSVGVAVWPPTVEGLHVDTGAGRLAISHFFS